MEKKSFNMNINRNEMVSYLDTILKTGQYRDSSSNGLQVQGAGDYK
jgi:hypothetical protein